MKYANEQKILDAIFDYFATTGVEIGDNEWAIDTFRSNGCTVTEDLFAKVPVDVAKKALSNIPSSFKWWNRAGDEYIEYGRRDKRYVIGDMRAPSYFSPDTKKVEPASDKALLESVALMNALPHIDVNGNLIATDNYHFDNAHVICNSNMPMMLGAGNYPTELENLIKMAIIVRGSKEKLSEKPFIATCVSGLMLKWPSWLLQQIHLCTEYNIPMFSSTMPVGGVSGPVTTPANILLGVGTTLFAMVLAQLAKPGLPCVDMYHSTYMDQANGRVGGMPENYIGEDMRISMLNNILGIPTVDGTTPCSNSLTFNQDAVFEICYNFRDSYLGLTNGVTNGYWGVGALETGIIYSPHALIFINELVDMAQKELKPFEINETTLPVDMVKRVKGGIYIAEEHTLENMNKVLWRGKYYHLGKVDQTLDIFDRMDNAYFEIMKDAKLEKLDKEKEEAIMKLAREGK